MDTENEVFFDSTTKVDLGVAQVDFAVSMMQYYTCVWVDGIPMPPAKARRLMVVRATESENQLVRCWPIDPRKENAGRSAP